MARKGRVRRWMKEKAGGEDGSMKLGIRASSASVKLSNRAILGLMKTISLNYI